MAVGDVRGVLQYVPLFRGRTFVVLFDEGLLPEPAVAETLLDLKALQEIGVRLVIGVLGEDASGVIAVLEQAVRGKGLSAKGRRVELRQLEDGPGLVEQVAPCHLLFVPRAQAHRWPELRVAVSKRPIVTVSDIEGFSRAEGIVEFVVERAESRGFERRESRVLLQICRQAAESVGLRFRSKLLRLRTVEDVCDGGGGET